MTHSVRTTAVLMISAAVLVNVAFTGLGAVSYTHLTLPTKA